MSPLILLYLTTLLPLLTPTTAFPINNHSLSSPPHDPPPPTSQFTHQCPNPNLTGKSDSIFDQPKPTRVDDGLSEKGIAVKNHVYEHHFEVPGTYCELTFAAKQAYGHVHHINIYDAKLVYEGTTTVAAVDKFGNAQDPDDVCTAKGECYAAPPVKQQDGYPMAGAAAGHHYEVPAKYAELTFEGKQAYGQHYNMSIFDTSLRYAATGGQEMAAVDDKGEKQDPESVYDKEGVYMGTLEEPIDEPRTPKEMEKWRIMWGEREGEWMQIGDEDRADKMKKGREKMENWWEKYWKVNH